jgi:hypothetical protein
LPPLVRWRVAAAPLGIERGDNESGSRVVVGDHLSDALHELTADKTSYTRVIAKSNGGTVR